jgi:tape measure domain-containing protein
VEGGKKVMSKEVDQRVVEMQFDNNKFEKAVDTTINTITRLKEKLNFEGQAKAFEPITKAAEKTDISALGKAADAVGQKFSSLEVMAITAISNITNRAISGAESVINQVSTMAMASAGWDKYNTKVQAVQTIMKATGEDIDSVSYKLQDLADYTDKTSYSYAQMVDNIGKFTANGVGLEDAIKAIEGVANVAAISGVGAADPAAARAMYNFSQALAAGSVKAIDWKSIENANMATKKFKEQIIATAKALGTLDKEGYVLDENGKRVKDLQVNYQNFRETLSEGWFSSDVLIATLKEFADAESDIGKEAYKAAAEAKTFQDALGAVQDALSSSWLQTYEYIFGNYEQATKLWTDIQDSVLEVMAPANEHRNQILGESLTSPYERFMKTLQEVNVSQEDFEESFRKILKSRGVQAVDEIKNIEDYFVELGSAGVDLSGVLNLALLDVTKQTGDLSEETEKYQKLVSDIINGKWGHGDARFSALRDAGFDDDFVQELVNKTVRGETIDWQEELKDKVDATGSSYNELITKIGEAGYSVRTFSEELYKRGGRQLFWEGVRNIFNSLVDIFHTVRDAWQEVFPPKTAKDVYDLISRFKQFTETLKPSEKQLAKIKTAFSGVFRIVKLFRSVLGGTWRIVSGFIKNIGISGDGLLDLFASIGDGLSKFADFVERNQFIEKAADKLLSWFIAAYNFVKDIVESDFIQSGLKTIGDAFSDLWEKLTTGFLTGNTGDAITSLSDTLNNFEETVDAESVTANVTNLTTTIDTLFTSIGKWWTGIGGFQGVIDALWSGFKTFLIIAGSSQALSFAVSAIFNIFARKKVSGFIEGLSSIATGISGFFSGIKKGIKNLGKAALIKSIGSALLDFAKAVAILGAVVLIFSFIKPDKLWDSVGVVAVLAAVVAAFMAVLMLVSKKLSFKNTLPLLALTGVLIGLSVAIIAFSVALGIINGISDPTKSLLTLAGVVAIMVGISVLLSTSFSSVRKGIGALLGSFGLIAAVGALILLIGALYILGTMNPETYTSGIKRMVPVLIALAALAGILQLAGKKALSTVAGAVSLMIVVTSMLELLGVIRLLGAMDTERFVVGLMLMVPIIAIIGGLLLSVRAAGKNALKASIALVVLTGFITTLSGIIYMLGGLPTENLVKGELALLGAALIIGLIATLLQQTTSKKRGIMGGVGALIPVATAISYMGPYERFDNRSAFVGYCNDNCTFIV